MPEAGRRGDKALTPRDSHGCSGCAHCCIGPAVTGSPNILINNKPALRVTDQGVHSKCCGSNTWEATQGATWVLFNNLAPHRKGDATRHCGGMGKLVEGSPNVMICNGSGNQIAPKKTWIEIVLRDDMDQPVAGEKYRITLPGGGIIEGRLDAEGKAKHEGIDAGACKVDFPERKRFRKQKTRKTR